MAERKQTVLQHMTELRRRLIAILAANLLAAAVCFYWVEPLLDLVLDLGSGCGTLGLLLCAEDPDGKLSLVVPEKDMPAGAAIS